MSTMKLKQGKKGLEALRQFEKDRKKERQQQKLLKLMTAHAKLVASRPSVLSEERPTPSASEKSKLPEVVDLSTLSIAVPGSILENAQSPALRCYLAGQIARAACIYKVNEVVVFDDVAEVGNEVNKKETINGTPVRRCCSQLARVLQYLECPQYLRKYIFPLHKDLSDAGLLNPLDGPHHLRQNDEFTFREGIVLNRPGKTSYVYVGLSKEVHVDRSLSPGLRVTVKLDPYSEGSKKIRGIIVPPTLPVKETGAYWGYSVRIANSLSQVMLQSPYKGGYDLTIGTSDKGTNIDELIPSELPKYEHGLIVFGGLQGLEQAMESDPMQEAGDPAILFDYYVNSCPTQGSKSIRTEEAVLITLAELRTKFLPKATFNTSRIDLA